MMTTLGVRFRGAAVVAAIVLRATPVTAQVAGVAGVDTRVPVSLGPLDLNVGGQVSRVASPVQPRTAYAFDASLRVPVRSGGFWIGSALEGAREIDSIPQRPLLRVGIWKSFRGIQLSIGASSRTARLGGRAPSTWTEMRLDSTMRDSGTAYFWTSKTFGDSGTLSHVARWSDLEGRLSWRFGRAGIVALIGARPTVDQFRPALWGHVGATYALTPYASLVGMTGSDAPKIALGVPAVHFASIALRIVAWPSAHEQSDSTNETFIVRRSSGQRHVVSFRMNEAESVELSGDFASWTPLALVRVRPGVWETTIDAPPGTYHVNLRVNGGSWFAPPGLPRAEDDFNGIVGILVLR